MYVCICKAVTDTMIQDAVREQGCCSMRELRDCLGVAGQCGRCAPDARQVLDATLQELACDIAGAA